MSGGDPRDAQGGERQRGCPASLAVGMVGLRDAHSYRRWLAAGVAVQGCDADAGVAGAAAKAGVEVHATAVAVAQALRPPRVVWLDVLPGRATELAMQDVWPELARGEIIVDGSHGDWRDACRREAALASAGIGFADAADLDGALWVGGAREAIERLEALLAARGAWRHAGAAGAAHFLRMGRADASHAPRNGTVHAARARGVSLPVLSFAAATAATRRSGRNDEEEGGT